MSFLKMKIVEVFFKEGEQKKQDKAAYIRDIGIHIMLPILAGVIKIENGI